MFYYLYEIKNKLNNKIYIGVHKTKNLGDGYMGSGKLISRAISKHGIENFTKTILYNFSTEEEMYSKEKEIVNEEFLNRKDVYNKKLGGPANFYYVNKNGLNHKSNQHLIHSDRIKNDSEYAKSFSETMKLASKKNKSKRSESLMGDKNPNKNKKWISNDILKQSIMVKMSDLESFTGNGWYIGFIYRKQRNMYRWLKR